MSKGKKVMIFLVEGPSDEAALGSILKEYFTSMEISFCVVHGDVTTMSGVRPDTVIKKINGYVKSLKDKYRYKDSDIIKIIHLVDTDGVFARPDCVRENLKVRGIQYYTDHMETDRAKEILRRNEDKAEVLHKLWGIGKIGSTPYRLYYMSCNLEHVLYNELRDFTPEEKWRYSDEFAERYEGKADEFVTFLAGGEFAVSGDCKESWQFIEKGENSLERHTNFQQIFS